MGARIRALDWSATPVGPIESWPQSLKLPLGICLNSRFPMFVWWGPGLINLYNDAYIPMLGRRHPAALGRPARASWDDIWSVVGPQAEAVMQRGEATWNERVLLVMERHGFTEETWFTWSYSPIYDEAGRVGGMYCAVVEETDRVRADEALRDAEQRYRAVFEASRDAMFIYTPEGVVVEANPAACRMYGFTRDHVVGVNALDAIHPDAVPHFRAFQRMALAGGEFRCETVDRRADGAVFPIEVSGTSLTYNGRPHLMSVIRDITDRRFVEAALRAGEEQMRLLTDALPALIGYVGNDLRYRFANRQYLDWFGLSPDQMIGRHLRDVLGEDVFNHRLPYAQAALRGEASHFEGTTHHRERGPLVCDVIYVPDARPDRGVAAGFVVLVQDITERKRNEEARRMTEVRFQRLVELSPLSTQIFWPDGRTRQVNGAWERLWGITLDDLRDYNILQDPQLAAAGALPILQRAFAGESAGVIEPFPYLVPFGPAAGQTRWAGAQVYPVKDASGRVEEVVLVHLDVTDQKRAEAAMARDAMLLAHVRDSVIMTDLDGVITFWNEGATRLFGWTADETVGRPYADRLPEADRAAVNAWIAQIAAGGGEFIGEWLDRRKDGSRVWIEANTRRVNDGSGKPVGIMGVAHDITERKAAEAERERLLASEQAARAEAERQGRMKDEFLATLGHELRTPLNAILGWAQILRGGGAADPEDLADGLRTIERNARAQTQIIEDLLDMSRIISGKVHLTMLRLSDVAPVLDAAIETIRPAADVKDVRLDVAVDPPAGPVAGDPNRLQQVFWNLLSNAVKFTPRGGTIRIRAARTGGRVEVAVADSGEGIPPDFLPHVFERFRQADASTTRRHGGLGLGLSIVRQLVELHGGSVAAHSEGPGRGATFTVHLPVATEASDPRPAAVMPRPVAPTPRAPAPHVAAVQGLKVLLVDDEADARAVLQWTLEDGGASVATAASVEEALRHFAADRPDVLISDIGMPGEDGYSLIRRVRALHPSEGGAVPAIALTAYARADDRIRALAAGFQHHVAKPVEPAELIAIIASVAKTPV